MILSTSSLNNFKCRSVEFRKLIRFCRVIIYFIIFFWKWVYTSNFFLPEAFLIQVTFYKPLNGLYVHFLSLLHVSEGITFFRMSSPFCRQCLEYCSTSCMPENPPSGYTYSCAWDLYYRIIFKKFLKKNFAVIPKKRQCVCILLYKNILYLVHWHKRRKWINGRLMTVSPCSSK